MREITKHNNQNLNLSEALGRELTACLLLKRSERITELERVFGLLLSTGLLCPHDYKTLTNRILIYSTSIDTREGIVI